MLLIVYFMFAQFLEIKKFRYLHESTLAILLGILLGLIFYEFENEIITFNGQIFFYFILPPIIFAAGYTLKSRMFFMNFGYILMYGFIGTFLSFITISVLA